MYEEVFGSQRLHVADPDAANDSQRTLQAMLEDYAAAHPQVVGQSKVENPKGGASLEDISVA